MQWNQEFLSENPVGEVIETALKNDMKIWTLIEFETLSDQHLPRVLAMAVNMAKWGLSHSADRVNDSHKHPWLNADNLWHVVPADGYKFPTVISQLPPLSDVASTALINRYVSDTE